MTFAHPVWCGCESCTCVRKLLAAGEVRPECESCGSPYDAGDVRGHGSTWHMVWIAACPCSADWSEREYLDHVEDWRV